MAPSFSIINTTGVAFPSQTRAHHIMLTDVHLPSAKVIISTAASAAATAMLIRSLAGEYLPNELTQYLRTKLHRYLTSFTNDITLTVDEFDGLNKNQLFYGAELYIGIIIAPSTKRIRATLPEKEHKIHISVGESEDVIDQFHGSQMKWRMVIQQTQPRYQPYPDGFSSEMKSNVRHLELTFHKKHRNLVINEYLPYILEKSTEIKQGIKTIKLHTLRNDGICGPGISSWQSVNLDHPAKFETLAMDDEIKEKLINDLDRFVRRKEMYRKVGKAWKRGYLLYGPPGTGKSSLIAAMANYLNFDVYDLELTDVRCNSDLRKLLISTPNRSILVVEDIDASIDLSERTESAPNPPPHFYPYPHIQENKVTLSGVLNFSDGLWSSCGDERIIVFTTNHKDKLDPALLRPGRMDVHIHMSYCTPCGFKMMAKNYTGLMEHPLVSEVTELIASTKVTPAEVGEQLLKGDDPGLTLSGLIKFLKAKMDEKPEVTPELKTRDINDEVKDLIEKVKGLSTGGVKAGMLKKDEAVDGLKSLIRHLEEEAGIKNNTGSDKSSESTPANWVKSEENGIKDGSDGWTG